jgi:hypothetical protein
MLLCEAGPLLQGYRMKSRGSFAFVNVMHKEKAPKKKRFNTISQELAV